MRREVHVRISCTDNWKNNYHLQIVVIAIVIIFVGDALNSLLENRKQIILNQLAEAENKAFDVKTKLLEAKNNFQVAQDKSQEIYNQISLTVQNDKNQLEFQTQDVIQRLKLLTQETILFQQRKMTKQISKQIIQLAVEQVQANLVNRMNSGFQLLMNNFYIALFCNYQ